MGVWSHCGVSLDIVLADSSGRGKLYIDDQLIVDNSEKQTKGEACFFEGTVEEKGRIHLEQGKAYRVRLEFNNLNLVDGASRSQTSVYTSTDETAGLQLMGAFRFGGSKIVPKEAALLNEAVELARSSDAVILLTGLSSDYAEEGCE